MISEPDSSNEKCRQFFVKLRWRGKRRYCPKCKYKRKIYSLSDGRFKCGRCAFKFQDFTYTYLQTLQIPFSEIVHLIHSFILDISPYRYNSKNVSLKTVQKFYTLIRQAIYDDSTWYLIKQIKFYNDSFLSPHDIHYNLIRHLIKQLKKLASDEKIEVNKAICSYCVRSEVDWKTANGYLVFGLYQQYGEIATFPAPKTDSLIRSIVLYYVESSSVCCLDDYHPYVYYIWLPIINDHVIVNREKNKTKDTNIIENFWNYSKDQLKRRIPLNYFHLYLKETEFRFNNRETKEEDLFLLVASLLVDQVPK